MPAPDAGALIDLDAAFCLHPQASLRPERFGALAYHFGTRRLSFLKSRRLLEAVENLASAPSARQALRDAGVGPAEEPRYAAALGQLLATEMIVASTARAAGGPGRSER